MVRFYVYPLLQYYPAVSITTFDSMIIYYFSSQEEIVISQKDILIYLHEMFAFFGTSTCICIGFLVLCVREIAVLRK